MILSFSWKVQIMGELERGRESKCASSVNATRDSVRPFGMTTPGGPESGFGKRDIERYGE